ncbi:DUF2071 domain-containing protein [bacterium]|nr:DUF2071 domain-containing protein [bacterium]
MTLAPTVEQRIEATRRPAGRSLVMHQRWERLLFLHWRVEPEVIQATLPPRLVVDTHDGHAYLGVVPFLMRGVRPRFCPAVPGVSSFLELNLRTYVHDDRGRPGVWFYSLDANQPIAVALARALFSLPYRHAVMRAAVADDGWVDVSSRRRGDQEQRFRYRPGAPLGPADPGSLEYFLAERYLLFAHRPRDGALLMGQVHHAPYPLTDVEVAAASRRLFTLNGFADPGRPAEHAMMAAGVAVSIYGLQRVSSLDPAHDQPRPGG